MGKGKARMSWSPSCLRFPRAPTPGRPSLGVDGSRHGRLRHRRQFISWSDISSSCTHTHGVQHLIKRSFNRIENAACWEWECGGPTNLLRAIAGPKASSYAQASPSPHARSPIPRRLVEVRPLVRLRGQTDHFLGQISISSQPNGLLLVCLCPRAAESCAEPQRGAAWSNSARLQGHRSPALAGVVAGVDVITGP